MSGADEIALVRQQLADLRAEIRALDTRVDDLMVFRGWVMGGLAAIAGIITAGWLKLSGKA